MGEKGLQATMSAIIAADREEKHLCPCDGPSRSTCFKVAHDLEKEYSIHKKKASVGTIARQKAMSSAISALSFAAACSRMVAPCSERDQITNADGSVYEASGHKDNYLVYAVGRGHEAVKGDVNEVGKDASSMKFSVKRYATGSAAGRSPPPVYIFPDARMKDNEIATYPVPGLGSGQEPNAVGYIVFCQTRACNRAFYKWWLMVVFLPFVEALREVHK
jgi:hypothetical protein